MTDSRLHVYNSQHHDCQTTGELHSLADAMRSELLHRIDGLEAERDALECCGNCPNLSASQQECDWDGGSITDWGASCRITPSRWQPHGGGDDR